MKRVSLRAIFLWLAGMCVSATAAGLSDAPTAALTSSEFVVTAWQMPQRLPSDRVRAVVQTRDGYLWVATYNGVAQFDGVRFRVFDDATTPALRNRLISCLFKDDRGRLWVGTDTGEITWRDESGFHPLAVTNHWPAFPIVRFAQAGDGAMWALNRNGFDRSLTFLCPGGTPENSLRFQPWGAGISAFIASLRLNWLSLRGWIPGLG